MVQQVGGDHYGEPTAYQHWDFAIDAGLPYLEGVASKYLCRWKDKGGVQDLYKSLSYVDKVLKSYELLHQRAPQVPLDDAIHAARKTAQQYKLTEQAHFFAMLLCLVLHRYEPADTGRNRLQTQRDIFAKAIAVIEAEGVLPPMHSPVPLTEENHHADRRVPRFETEGRK